MEGAGLGLAITSRLLSMMGGGISVKSTYGEGSCFTAILPQKVVSCEPVGNIRLKDEHTGNSGTAYHESFRAPDARILIVDDTRINITVTAGLLRKTGVRTDSAQSGDKALELAEKTPYDLILMDQRMPGMDGIETLHMIRSRKDGVNSRTPVICMTADAIIGAKEKYTAEGFTDYLPKPVSGEMLEKMLIRYLPKEKIITAGQESGPDTATAEEKPAPKDRLSDLDAAGIDTKAGMLNCQEDEELYFSLLHEYAANAGEKHRKMQAYYRDNDWKQYSILVHAMKSSSRLIGASALAEKAAELEKAADECRKDDIVKMHQSAMEQYLHTADAISACAVKTPDEEEPDDSVLEFYPGE